MSFGGEPFGGYAPGSPSPGPSAACGGLYLGGLYFGEYSSCGVLPPNPWVPPCEGERGDCRPLPLEAFGD